jgi:hypothetical protein
MQPGVFIGAGEGLDGPGWILRRGWARGETLGMQELSVSFGSIFGFSKKTGSVSAWRLRCRLSKDLRTFLKAAVA